MPPAPPVTELLTFCHCLPSTVTLFPPIPYSPALCYTAFMYEIELKAHVADADAVLKALHAFARPAGVTQKRDTYYRLYFQTGGQYLTCRIREEVFEGEDGTESKNVLFTYKRKALVKDGGNAIEVNDEKECRMDNKDALEAMLLDAGFVVSHKKQKHSQGFVCKTDCGTAHIELCNVPPLGNFLEVEIMSSAHDKETVHRANEAIKGIFKQCGIGEEAIEERYYTQMLEEGSNAGGKGK